MPTMVQRAAPAVEFLDSTQATGVDPSVTKPTGVASGDYVIIVAAASNMDINGVSGGTTWSKLQDGTIASGSEPPQYCDVWGKVAGGSEPSTYSVDFAGAANGQVACLAYRNVGTVTTQASEGDNIGTGTHPASFDTSIDPIADGGFGIAVYWLNRIGGSPMTPTDPSGMTQLESVTARADWLLRVLHEAGGGSLGTKNLTTTETDVVHVDFALKVEP